ncbi:MAG: WD40 repeat domain-containing protein, partial [Actinomycetia bacterium]|nr:WD40 repeat domain-containing protein [Actinomycetes bacterium]
AVSGDTTMILEGHTDGVVGVGWGEIDGQPRLATASNDRTVRVWDPATSGCLFVVPASGALAVDLSGCALAVGLARGLFVIDLS